MNLRGFLKRETPAVRPTLQSLIEDFWDSVQGTGGGFSPRQIERVWAANRCIQLNSQQIASMPLRFFGGSSEPAWLGNPDPVWFPNGVGDAIFAAVRSMYGWGDAFLFITSRYADGRPASWTVLDPDPVVVTRGEDGRRRYRSGDLVLPPRNVVQISRDPTGGLRGTSALAAYASPMLSAIASGDLGKTIMDGGIPNAILKTEKKITQEQAEAIQAQWMTRSAIRRGAPAILPPDIDFKQLAFSPKDLLLIEAQEFDSRRIASAFGVPPYMLNIPLEGGLTYQSPAMLFETWWRSELRPAAGRIARALSANMLPRGSWVEFDARDVLAPSFADQVNAWEKILEMEAGTVDEFRASVLRLPPQSEEESVEDLLTPPVAATSLSQNGTASNITELRPTTEVRA